MFSLRRTWILACCVGMATAQAARTPPLDYAPVERAIAAAQAVDARHYAPVDLRFAEENLAAARQAESERKSALAQQYLERAAINAELARVKANTARLRERVAAAEAENQKLRRRLREEPEE